MDQYIIFLYSYLIGSIPFGLIIARVFAGKDIRKEGSGNIGTTNVLRTVGKKSALLTLLLDGIKGVIAILITQILFKYHPYDVYLSGFAAIIGHMFPIWLKFKGGKGVATSAFVLLYINPILGLTTIGTWIIVFYLSRISSLSAIVAAALSPVYAITMFTSEDLPIFCFVISSLVLVKHASNFKRIIRGEEKPFK
ncbi:MAG: glycerol-3-phosphate 1-O-acyltransferase PlsY [Alphaproteobacteria bacterium]|nr:glycerol-3-phosphate 1-O-acyltransferase PlsY [Alphaproteobacteria bacterium]OJV13841.1 MAG: acyl-phosphate glycerol 3-phosphate acyltransferase [Alphaproteobacteria bacterium 33-17]